MSRNDIIKDDEGYWYFCEYENDYVGPFSTKTEAQLVLDSVQKSYYRNTKRNKIHKMKDNYDY